MSITKAPLTIGITAYNKEFDNTAEAEVTFSGDRISGDVFEITYPSALFNDANVGDPKPVEVLGISLSGGQSGNYNLVNSSASASARALTVTLTEQLQYIKQSHNLRI